jgi:hypothetical protein
VVKMTRMNVRTMNTPVKRYVLKDVFRNLANVSIFPIFPQTNFTIKVTVHYIAFIIDIFTKL